VLILSGYTNYNHEVRDFVLYGYARRHRNILKSHCDMGDAMICSGFGTSKRLLNIYEIPAIHDLCYLPSSITEKQNTCGMCHVVLLGVNSHRFGLSDHRQV
jgi:hypothetical protein